MPEFIEVSTHLNPMLKCCNCKNDYPAHEMVLVLKGLDTYNQYYCLTCVFVHEGVHESPLVMEKFSRYTPTWSDKF